MMRKVLYLVFITLIYAYLVTLIFEYFINKRSGMLSSIGGIAVALLISLAYGGQVFKTMRKRGR